MMTFLVLGQSPSGPYSAGDQIRPTTAQGKGESLLRHEIREKTQKWAAHRGARGF